MTELAFSTQIQYKRLTYNMIGYVLQNNDDHIYNFRIIFTFSFAEFICGMTLQTTWSSEVRCKKYRGRPSVNIHLLSPNIFDASGMTSK